MIILHITDQRAWQNALEAGEYLGDSLDHDGFIHCCLAAQTEQVLEQWFSGRSNLLVLEIDSNRLAPEVIFENLESGDEKFPHIYGPINLDAVIHVQEIHSIQKGNLKNAKPNQ